MSRPTNASADLIDAQQALVAGEIHDSLLPHLFVAKMRLEAMLARLDQEQTSGLPSGGGSHVSLRDELLLSVRSIQHAMDVGRQLLGEISSDNLSGISWSQHLASAGEAYSDDSPVRITIEGDLDQWVTSERSRFAARRIAQEAIRNAIRHGKSSVIKVVTEPCSDRLAQVTICDNGCGFNPDHKTSGYGMRLMRTRAKLAGGKLTVESNVGGPTVIKYLLDRYDDVDAV